MTPPNKLRPLGILGGTFDPIHFGHLHLAETARHALHLESVRFIPAGQPPHREAPGVSAQDRLAMVRLATAGNPGFVVDPREVEDAAKSYTVVTLQGLRAELGATRPLVLLLGADAFLGLPSWYHWHALFALAHIAIASRPGYPLPAMPPDLAQEFSARNVEADALAHSPAGKIVCFDITPLAISATHIRSTLAARGSVRYLCPDSVLDYIAEHRLYC